MTVRADLPVIFDAAFTARTKRQIFQRLEQRFFFQSPLIFLFEGARWTKDKIDQHTWQIEHSHKQCRERLHQRIAGARANIAICPNDKGDP